MRDEQFSTSLYLFDNLCEIAYLRSAYRFRLILGLQGAIWIYLKNLLISSAQWFDRGFKS